MHLWAVSAQEYFFLFIAFFLFFQQPLPRLVLSFLSLVLYDGGEVGLETETDRCSSVWCLTCSHSMRSSRGGDVFDSSDSLTMITLSLGVLLKVSPSNQANPNTFETLASKHWIQMVKKFWLILHYILLMVMWFCIYRVYFSEWCDIFILWQCILSANTNNVL